MREIQQLLIYLAGTTFLVLGIISTGLWAFSEYRPQLPPEPAAHTTAVATDSAHSAAEDKRSRQPVWIEPTIKYVYAPLDVTAVKSAQTPYVTLLKGQEKRAAKPKRRSRTIRIDREARRAYGAAGSVERGQQLRILPLQHQAPH